MNNSRSYYIDTIKCIAIFLVVFGHCIQYGSGSDFLKNELFFYNPFFKFIYSFHMPLLMMVSGYLYYNTISKKNNKEIIISKIKSLILPGILFGTIIFLFIGIKQIITNEFQIGMFIKNYILNLINDLWFLKALFIFDIIVLIINRCFKDNIIVYLLNILITFLLPNKSLITVCSFTFPFFMIGYFYNKYNIRKKIYSKFNKKNMFIFFVICIICYISLLFFYTYDSYIYTSGFTLLNKTEWLKQIGIDIYRFIIGVLGCISVLIIIKILYDKLIKKNDKIKKIINFIGKNTLGIYIISQYINIYILNKITSKYEYNVGLVIVETIIILISCLFLSYIIKKNNISSILLGGKNK